MVETLRATKKGTKKAAPKIKALMPADPSVKSPTVIAPMCFTHVQKKIEQVGSGYEALKMRHHRMNERIEKGASAQFTDSESDVDEEETKEGGRSRGNSQDQTEKKRHKKTKEDVEREALEKGDLYGVLGLDDKNHEATEKDIVKAYRMMALKYHPDKLGEDITETEKAQWLKIQDAYETLCDAPKRRKYDSSLPFDDTIPKVGDWTDETFYEVFDSVFARNSMWAKTRPTPEIGNKDTPMAQVRKFYKFWDNFNSWREFAQYDEYNLDEAQDRYERRYMEKENRKCRAEHEKNERKRLIRLAERAYNNDPRIRAENEKIEAEKQKIKDAKKDFRTKQFQAKDAIKNQLAAEKKAAEDEKAATEKREAEERKQRAIAYKKSIKQLVELCTAKMPKSKFDRFWVESIQRQVNNVEKVMPIIEHLEMLVDDVEPQFAQYVKEMFMSDAEKQAARAAADKEVTKIQATEWTKEEMALLTEAIKKFPPGTGDRWAVVSNFIGTRSQKETIAKAKEVQQRREDEALARKEKEIADAAAAKQKAIDDAAKAKAEAAAALAARNAPKPQTQAPTQSELPENKGWSIDQ